LFVRWSSRSRDSPSQAEAERARVGRLRECASHLFRAWEALSCATVEPASWRFLRLIADPALVRVSARFILSSVYRNFQNFRILKKRRFQRKHRIDLLKWRGIADRGGVEHGYTCGGPYGFSRASRQAGCALRVVRRNPGKLLHCPCSFSSRSRPIRRVF